MSSLLPLLVVGFIAISVMTPVFTLVNGVK